MIGRRSTRAAPGRSGTHQDDLDSVSRVESFDAIVVGLGAAGSATIYHLARSGVSVLGIDRHSPPHPFGSSHGDTRITRCAVGEGEAYIPFAMRSHDLWRELEAESGATLLHQVGALILSPARMSVGIHGSDDFMRTTIALAKRHHINHEVVAHDDIVERYPQFHLDDDHVGYFEPGAGYVLVEDAIRVQLDLAESRGAYVRRNERVVDVRSTSRGVEIETGRGRYGAGVAILAVGAGLPQLLPPELAGLFRVYRQTVYWYDVADVAAMSPGVCPVFIWPFGVGEEDVFYGFPALDGPDGGVKIGTEQYRTVTAVDESPRVVQPGEVAAAYQRCVAGRIPALRPTVVRAAACLYTITPDFGFVIDRHPEFANVIVASPCSGHGFKHSAAVGETLAELAVTGASALDVSPFSLRRFAASGR